MALPVMDEHHQDLKEMVQQIAFICQSDEFLLLRKELESLYLRSGQEHPSLTAFQDALYTLMAQKEVNWILFKAY